MGRSLPATGLGTAVLFGVALLLSSLTASGSAAQEDALVQPVPPPVPSTASLPSAPPVRATSRLETAVFALG